MIYLSYQSKYTGLQIDNKLDQVDNINSNLNNKLNSADLLNKVYPVGSIYMSYNSTSPASLFGGTWTQIKDKVLMSAGDTYTGGSTGGSATHTHTSAAHTHTVAGHTHTSAAHTHTVAGHTHTTAGHTLTIAEMPSHTHQVGTYHGGVGDGSVVQRGWGSETVHKNLSVLTNTGGGGSHSHGNTGSTSLTTDSTTPGNTGSSSNMPPYIQVSMWRRTE